MRKVALCMEYPLHQHGGVEVLVRELLSGLSEHFELFLVSGDSAGALERSPLRPHFSDHFPWPTATASRSDGEALAAWLAQQRIDLVHFHFGGTYQWRARSWTHCPVPIVAEHGIPCVSTNHGAFSIFECVGMLRPLWFKLAALPLFWPAKLRQVAAVRWEATVSNHDLAAVRRRFFPVRGKFLRIYHSRISGSRPFREQKDPFILCLGTVGYRKGQPYLVEAFGEIAKNHPGWKLVLAGRHAEDSSSAEIDRLITTHHIQDRVELLKDVSDSLADDLLDRAAIFAFPSLKEGLGLALQEAMYAGAACVGSNTGGITDLIEHQKTGLLCPPADPEALASALTKLIQDAELRKNLSETGRRSIEEKGMTRKAMILRHKDLYERTISEK